jgi:hypothetical protein
MTHETTIDNGSATISTNISPNKKALRSNNDKMHMVYRRPVCACICMSKMKEYIIPRKKNTILKPFFEHYSDRYYIFRFELYSYPVYRWMLNQENSIFYFEDLR